ncbi:RDD family protein [Streptomyces alboniger]
MRMSIDIAGCADYTPFHFNAPWLAGSNCYRSHTKGFTVSALGFHMDRAPSTRRIASPRVARPPHQWASTAESARAPRLAGRSKMSRNPGFNAPYPALQYASWGSRLKARISDSVFSITASPVSTLVLTIIAHNASHSTTRLIGWLGLVGNIVGIFKMTHEIGKTGQTRGRRMAHIRVIDADTFQPIGFSRSFLRLMAQIVDGCSTIGPFRPLWNSRRQTYADLISRSIVVVAW